jgi:hypothetical protein
MLQSRSCVLRQAQDEALFFVASLMPFSVLLILSLSKDAG